MLRFKKKIYPVQTYGAPVLKAVAIPINELSKDVHDLAARMIDTMFAFDGIGLAGPQIGVSRRIITLGLSPQTPPGDLSEGEIILLPEMPMAIINPRIISFSDEHYNYEEGCLSVPEIYAPVNRPSRIVFQGEILGHGMVTLECGGLLGRCIQHEIDHLDGTVFVERVNPIDYRAIEVKVKNLIANGTDHNFLRMK